VSPQGYPFESGRGQVLLQQLKTACLFGWLALLEREISASLTSKLVRADIHLLSVRSKLEWNGMARDDLEPFSGYNPA
jgi:hypothetical protein